MGYYILHLAEILSKEKSLMVNAIEWKDGKVIMLDQSKLPLEVTYIECRTTGQWLKV